MARSHNRLRENLCLPTQPVVQGEVRPNLPRVLCKESDVFVGDRRSARGVSGGASQSRALQVEQQWSTAGRAARTGVRRSHESSVGATHCVWSKATRRGRRRITQKPGDAVEEITSLKESTKHLIIKRVQPFATKLHGVIAGDDREIVLQVCAPEEFIDCGSEEEWVSEAEGCREAHRRICRNV